MKRLNQLVTRLLIIALIALAAWVGRAHLGKQALIFHLQSAVGAKVDAKSLSLNSDDATVFLNQVEIADPLVDRQNLLQFEAASLQLDFDQLKYRRIVIEDGRLSQINFAAPRTKSGKLARGIFDSHLPPQQTSEKFETVAGKPQLDESLKSYSLAQRWRDSIVVGFGKNSGPVDHSFETPSLLNERSEQWAVRFKEPTQRISQVESSLAMVEKVLQTPLDQFNTLRNRDTSKLKSAIEALESSKLSLDRVGLLIAEFEAQSQKEAYELSQVQMRDKQKLTSANGVQKFDEKLINQLLVGDVERQLVADGLNWFQQFRNSLPNPDSDFRPLKRGRDFHFGETPDAPAIEIQKLQIDGSAEFANSHFQFAGTVENITDDPQLNDSPMRFNLRAQGDPQVVVSGTLDRSSGRSTDTIEFTGIGMPHPAYALGDQNSMLISMTNDSRLHVEATINSDQADRLSGTMTFRFDNVLLHADSVHPIAGGAETAARLNETVSGIHSFQITTTLGGTIEKPTSVLACDLGRQVAVAMESVFLDSQQLALRKKETLLTRTIDGSLTQLKENVAEGISDLNETWRENYSRLNRLNRQLSTAQGPLGTRPEKLR